MSSVRHIPEDELHAYLDQALSRSQGVEIERHLARCPRCQFQRDDIAALRDRTTALLARVGPPPIIPPAFETIVAQAAARERRRWRWLRAGAWAASIAGVLTLGWWTTGRLLQVESRVTATPPKVAPEQAAPRAEMVRAPVTSRPARVSRKPQPRPEPRQLVRASRPAGEEALAAPGFAMATETDPQTVFESGTADRLAVGSAPFELNDLVAQPVGDEPGLNGLWRTIVPGDEAPDRRADIALVPGLPVVQMRVQPGTAGDDVTAVDQMLESGDMIRTISGPASRVLTLVNEDAAADSATTRIGSGSTNHLTVTIRQADRMVAVTGPSQALGSLLARVNIKNAKRRY
jgi:hypothetical protein